MTDRGQSSSACLGFLLGLRLIVGDPSSSASAVAAAFAAAAAFSCAARARFRLWYSLSRSFFCCAVLSSCALRCAEVSSCVLRCDAAGRTTVVSPGVGPREPPLMGTPSLSWSSPSPSKSRLCIVFRYNSWGT